MGWRGTGRPGGGMRNEEDMQGEGQGGERWKGEGWGERDTDIRDREKKQRSEQLGRMTEKLKVGEKDGEKRSKGTEKLGQRERRTKK